MSRVGGPRIRSVKPEIWADEKIGTCSRDARILFVGLITMADDEGRFRALHSVLVGHIFPYDTDAPRKINRWLKELLDRRLVDLYEINGVPYGLLTNWSRHQRISHPKASSLPSPSMNGSHAD